MESIRGKEYPIFTEKFQSQLDSYHPPAQHVEFKKYIKRLKACKKISFAR